DAKLELLYPNGSLVVPASDPGDSLNATVSVPYLSAGTYYLRVSSHGNYGDVGQYTISGTVSNTPSAGVKAASDPKGHSGPADNTQHTVYRGQDGDIYELWFNAVTGKWGRADLTVRTGAPLAASAPMGYAFDADQSQNIVYRSADGRINELRFLSGVGW